MQARLGLVTGGDLIVLYRVSLAVVTNFAVALEIAGRAALTSESQRVTTGHNGSQMVTTSTNWIQTVTGGPERIRARCSTVLRNHCFLAFINKKERAELKMQASMLQRGLRFDPALGCKRAIYACNGPIAHHTPTRLAARLVVADTTAANGAAVSETHLLAGAVAKEIGTQRISLTLWPPVRVGPGQQARLSPRSQSRRRSLGRGWGPCDRR